MYTSICDAYLYAEIFDYFYSTFTFCSHYLVLCFGKNCAVNKLVDLNAKRINFHI